MNQHILVVDDDYRVRQLYRTMLALAGFSVDTAEDGLSALHKIEAERPNLVVLDLEMPRVDGCEVLTELRSREDTHDIPVVVVTGTDFGDAVAEQAPVLQKPCEPDELISIIEQHLPGAA